MKIASLSERKLKYIFKKPARTSIFFFADIIGLSKSILPTNKQIEKIKILNKFVNECSAYKNLPAECMKLPTGDGMAIDFRDSTTGSISLSIQLHRKLHEYNSKKDEDEQVRIRIGIGSGTVFETPDINGEPNVWGPAIILARRIMDLGDEDHILIHQHLADAITKDYEEFKKIIHPLGEYPIKHGEIIPIASIHASDFGSNKIPSKKIEDSKSILEFAYGPLTMVWKDPQMTEIEKLENLIRGVETHNIDPKLMYWETWAARRYKRLCEDRKYEIDRISRKLLGDNFQKMFNVIKEDTSYSLFDYVSLGAGGAEKDSIIIQELINNAGGERLFYFPLDQSFSMLSYAIDYISPVTSANNNLGLFAIYGDFTNLSRYGSMIYNSHNPKIYSLLGNTLGNVDEGLVLTQIRDTMRNSDRLIVGVSLTGGRTDKELERGYDVEAVRDLLTAPLIEKLSYDQQLSDSFRNATVYAGTIDKGVRVPGSRKVQVYLKANDIEYKFAYAMKYDLDNLLKYLKSDKIGFNPVGSPILAFDEQKRPVYAKFILRK